MPEMPAVSVTERLASDYLATMLKVEPGDLLIHRREVRGSASILDVFVPYVHAHGTVLVAATPEYQVEIFDAVLFTGVLEGKTLSTEETVRVRQATSDELAALGLDPMAVVWDTVRLYKASETPIAVERYIQRQLD